MLFSFRCSAVTTSLTVEGVFLGGAAVPVCTCTRWGMVTGAAKSQAEQGFVWGRIFPVQRGVGGAAMTNARWWMWTVSDGRGGDAADEKVETANCGMRDEG